MKFKDYRQFRDYSLDQLGSFVNSRDLLSLSGTEREAARNLYASKSAEKVASDNLRASKKQSLDSAILSLKADVRSANATAYRQSLKAGQAATNSSRLLAEFEKQRSIARTLRDRKSVKASGQIKAGFAATEVASIGAESEFNRASNKERIGIETELNKQKQAIINEGSTGVSRAFSQVASKAPSIAESVGALNLQKEK